MAKSTFLTQLRTRLNIKQHDLAALFQSRRGIISQIECGARSLTSKQVEVLDALAVSTWRKPSVGDRLLSEADEQTRQKLKGYSDDLLISLHHAREKLSVLQKNYQADTEALVWLRIMKEAVEASAKPDKRILTWIDSQVAAKHEALKNNSMDKQVVCAARIAGIEAELRLIRNMVAKKKVVVKRVPVS